MRNSFDRQVISLGWALHCTGCIAFIAILGSYYAFVTCPLNAMMDQSASRVAQLEAIKDQAPKIRAVYSQSKAELRVLEESIAEASLCLPALLEENEFIDQVRSAASTLDVDVANYELGTTNQLENYSRAAITFQCNGSFASICRLLDRIDHLSRLTEISRLEIGTNNNMERYSLQVTFDLYFGAISHDKSMRGEVL